MLGASGDAEPAAAWVMSAAIGIHPQGLGAEFTLAYAAAVWHVVRVCGLALRALELDGDIPPQDRAGEHRRRQPVVPSSTGSRRVPPKRALRQKRHGPAIGHPTTLSDCCIAVQGDVGQHWRAIMIVHATAGILDRVSDKGAVGNCPEEVRFFITQPADLG